MMEAIHRVFNNAVARKVLLQLRLVLGLLALAGLAILIRRSPDEWFWPGFGVSVFDDQRQSWHDRIAARASPSVSTASR